ncbi:uncharacterized protein LOC127241662 isoform X2 [Andrographis paniculata]|nr:uncharacterized protein LOC127241662 isoform X2 [Andrographis paniculata]
MNSQPQHDHGDNEEAFLDETDIINVHDIDEEDLPDADDEETGGEVDSDVPDADDEETSGGDVDLEVVDDSMHIFTGHTDELYASACSPVDAILVATGGGDDKGFLWKINREDGAFELPGHRDSVSSLSFSTDGQLLATGGLDGVVKVWDTVNGELKCTLDGPSEGIEWIKWHPKGHVILAGAEDASIWMWNADRATYLQTFTGHGSSVTCGDFTPDGRTICSGSQDATLRIWNPKTAENIHVVRGHPYHTEGLTCLAISSDSTLALTGASDGSVHVVNISTGKVVISLNPHSDSVECAAFEASSRKDSWRAATGGMDKKLMIWDQNSSPRCVCDHEDGVTCLLWLSSSRYIATGCLDGDIRVWDSLSGDCVKKFRGHAGPIQSISATADGNFLVSASLDGTSRVFEIAEFR